MKKAGIFIKAILAIVALLAVGTMLFIILKDKEPEENVINTDTAPIYHHFPGLPPTGPIQWCSRTSDGIGLTTVWVYAFLFYDHDISGAFGEAEILDEEPDFYFWPKHLAQDNDTWRKLDVPVTAFQDGIKEMEKMSVSVYLNEEGNILYLEAVGD